jgi:hypothetical protein
MASKYLTVNLFCNWVSFFNPTYDSFNGGDVSVRTDTFQSGTISTDGGQNKGIVAIKQREISPDFSNEIDFDASDISSTEIEDISQVRENTLQFMTAQLLAGQKRTAQEIAAQLYIPLEIAQIAVLNPIGNNIQVDVPDLAEFNQNGILIAGKGGWVEPVLRTIQRLIPFVKGGAKNLKNWIFKSPPKISPGKQGKHIPGHNNYIPGKSILSHPDPQSLINKFAGKGQSVNNVPKGQPGYKERVDFREVIGNFVDQKTGKSIPTTKGIIHYAKDGVHIVPARP